ncbi:DUF6265 family protein [Dyadobacter sandarakinus]|uniref:DUF6265 domain-containing protein n=1 Tax=Dyadobacter sandarakinus TaxID=2747268 RepID=A0ABX7IBE6_9BACT|nr:DUF6265 family protein [Dyadobacter sandarakinus]QRR02772.1 hypothetical protein HWI92_18560 [Dyadobacter sandarakinus]
MTVMSTARSFMIPVLFVVSMFSAQAQSKGSLKDVSFLEGHWQGTYNGGPIEASWTAPAGNNIMGYIRMIKDDKPALYEVFAFEETEKGPVAMVKHFKPGLIAVEEKEVSDRYNFIETKKNQTLFEKDDASVRIIYERRAADQLVIQRGKQENGKWAFVDLFIFKKVP